MSGFYLHCTEDQLRTAAIDFIGNGPAGTKALRQAEVDGAFNVLMSASCKKLRTDPTPPPQPQRTVLGAHKESP